MTKGIRGAITVDENTEEAIKASTLELLSKMLEENSINIADISHVIFTLTNDLNAAFPARFARLDMGFDDVAMMCYHELDVPNSLPKCLRILIVLNCSDDFVPKMVYLREAKNLKK